MRAMTFNVFISTFPLSFPHKVSHSVLFIYILKNTFNVAVLNLKKRGKNIQMTNLIRIVVILTCALDVCIFIWHGWVVTCRIKLRRSAAGSMREAEHSSERNRWRAGIRWPTCSWLGCRCWHLVVKKKKTSFNSDFSFKVKLPINELHKRSYLGFEAII